MKPIVVTERKLQTSVGKWLTLETRDGMSFDYQLDTDGCFKIRTEYWLDKEDCDGLIEFFTELKKELELLD